MQTKTILKLFILLNATLLQLKLNIILLNATLLQLKLSILILKNLQLTCSRSNALKISTKYSTLFKVNALYKEARKPPSDLWPLIP